MISLNLEIDVQPINLPPISVDRFLHHSLTLHVGRQDSNSTV